MKLFKANLDLYRVIVHVLVASEVVASFDVTTNSAKQESAVVSNPTNPRVATQSAGNLNQTLRSDIQTTRRVSTAKAQSQLFAFGVKTFECATGSPEDINQWKFCDGHVDCADGSDEVPATSAFQRTDMLVCSNTVNSNNDSCLIEKQQICEEQISCYGKTPCTEGCPTHFVCPGGECKKRSTVCNNDTCDDCNGLDGWKNGHGFKCTRNGGRCNLPQVLLYDGVKDCDDGSDMCYAVDGGPLTNIPRDIRNSSSAKFNSRICFQCLDKSLIVRTSSVCDGIIDCPDLTDECLCEGERPAICEHIQVYASEYKRTSNCSVGELVCSDGSCVKRNKICDGIVDCKDAIDEQFEHCGGTIPCSRAATMKKPCRCYHMAAATCLQKTGVFCDDVADCIHRSRVNWFVKEPEDECSGHCHEEEHHGVNSTYSEFNCSASMFHPPPGAHSFTCRSGQNISNEVGFADCSPDALMPNERHGCDLCFYCETPTGFSILRSKVCDGVKDCSDGEDELQSMCEKEPWKRFYCSALGGQKVSIAGYEVCDFTINCDNQADETNCSATNRFYCENKEPLFVHRHLMYNGFADCTDWSDECPTTATSTNANVLSSRQELIASPLMRILVWILGILALIGNLAVFVHEIRFLRATRSRSASLRTNHMLMLNLAVADMLMGIYLLMLEAASIEYHGLYCSYDHAWRSSSRCTAMGVLVALSSESSVITMVLLTAFRLYAVYNPIKASTKPKASLVLLLILLNWTISFLLALMPLDINFQNKFTNKADLADMPFFNSAIVEFSTFQVFMKRLLTFGATHHPTTSDSLAEDLLKINAASSWLEFKNVLHDEHGHMDEINILRYYGYYSANSVCIPNILVTTSDSAWKFSFSISMLNFFAFVFVTAAYVIIYKKSGNSVLTNSTGKRKKKRVSKQIKAVQRKIFRLILTDFCCWVPISLMVILHLAGVKLGSVSYAVAAIVLLPINSALNPIIYSDVFDRALDFCCRKRRAESDVTFSSHSVRNVAQRHTSMDLTFVKGLRIKPANESSSSREAATVSKPDNS